MGKGDILGKVSEWNVSSSEQTNHKLHPQQGKGKCFHQYKHIDSAFRECEKFMFMGNNMFIKTSFS